MLKIAKEDYKYYVDQVMYLVGKGHGIIEFCRIPVMNKSFKVNKKTKDELRKIEENIRELTDFLEKFKMKADEQI